MRPPWDFAYAPARVQLEEPTEDLVLVVATTGTVAPSRLSRALRDAGLPGVTAEAFLDRGPVHWSLLRADRPLPVAACEAALATRGVKVRYVAAGTAPSQRLPPPLPAGPRLPPVTWEARHEPVGRDPVGPGAWHLGERGINVDRALCGYGIGTRVAIIDSDGGGTAELGLDALVAVGREAPDPRRLVRHGATCVGWAVGVAGHGLSGVAPGASARLYCIPKAGADVYTFPAAVVLAAADGADVIGCATYQDQTTSPMLEDALAFAHELGRGGRGTPIVLAASREMSSTLGLTRASLSLDLGDPVADPRVMCAAASGASGGWFLWRDKHGELQPFSNRGPSVRFMAPGDDVTDPLHPSRLAHAESSGATAFSVGVVALVLAHNPELTAGELAELLRLSSRVVSPELDRRAAATRAAGDTELRPFAVDPDGHNAKHGYGRLDATVACTVARDPIALGLLGIGERGALLAWATQAPSAGRVSRRAALGLCRLLLTAPALRYQLATLLRHLRLVAQAPDARLHAHAPGALTRLAAVMLRSVSARLDGEARAELDGLARALTDCTRSPEGRRELERELAHQAARLFPPPSDDERAAGEEDVDEHGAHEHGAHEHGEHGAHERAAAERARGVSTTEVLAS